MIWVDFWCNLHFYSNFHDIIEETDKIVAQRFRKYHSKNLSNCRMKKKKWICQTMAENLDLTLSTINTEETVRARVFS